jgi:hypothetical protein
MPPRDGEVADDLVARDLGERSADRSGEEEDVVA